MRLFDPGLPVSVGASDPAGFIQLPRKYLSHTQFLLRMLFCVPGFYANPRFRKRLTNRDAAAWCTARTHVPPTVAFVLAGKQGNRGWRPSDETGLQNIITEAQVLKCQLVR